MTASWYCLVVVYTHRTIRFVAAAAAEVEGGNHSAVAVVAVELLEDGNHSAGAAVFAAAELEDGNHSAVEKVAVVGADMKTEDHFAAVGTALAAVAVEQSFAAE